MSGRASLCRSTGRSYCRRTSRLASALGAQVVSAETARAKTDRVAGFHRSVSMPFRMPTRSDDRRAQDAIESEAQFRRLYFACVLRADGGDQVGVVDPAFREN